MYLGCRSRATTLVFFLQARYTGIQFQRLSEGIFGPVVKWYYAAFALLSREFDSPQVHHIGFFIAKDLTYLEDKPQLGSSKSYICIAYSLGKNWFLEPRIQT